MKRRITCFVLFVMMFVLTVFPVSAGSLGGYLLIDNADALSDSTIDRLGDELMTIRDKYSMDVRILVLDDYRAYSEYDTGSAENFTKSFYQQESDMEDAIVLMLSLAGGEGNRDWYMFINGEARVAVNDYGFDYISERLVDKLADEKFEEGISDYVDDIKDFMKEYAQETPYGVDHKVRTTMDYVLFFGIGIAIAFVIALVIILVMKSSMNTAKPQLQAREYVKKDSFVLTNQQDIFLYSNMSKTPIPKNNSSSGGGSTSGSRGGSGGGGKF